MPYDPFTSVVTNHVSRYPLMQAADLYKLAHQAALGSEHGITSIDAARTWLERELANMGAGPSEPMLDPISGDGRILRCHLRPFIQGGFDPEALLRAFVGTAEVVRRSPTGLQEYLDVILELAESRIIGIARAGLSDYFIHMQAGGYPAVHHSPEFVQAYRPAYRVVSRDFLENMISL